MGKPTGFLEYDRCENRRRPALERVRDWEDLRSGIYCYCESFALAAAGSGDPGFRPLLRRILDAVRNLHRLIMIIPKDIIDRVLCDDALILVPPEGALPGNCAGQLVERIVKDVLVALFSLPNLFIKPSHFHTPLVV